MPTPNQRPGEDVSDLASVSVSKLKVYVPAQTSGDTTLKALVTLVKLPFEGGESAQKYLGSRVRVQGIPCIGNLYPIPSTLNPKP